MYFVDLPGDFSRSFSQLASFRFPEPTTLLLLQGHVCAVPSQLCVFISLKTPLTPQPLGFLNLFLKICISVFIFGYAESSLLSRLFSSCGEWRLLSGSIPRASHCNGFPCRGARPLGHSASVEAVDSGVAAPGLESTGSVV